MRRIELRASSAGLLFTVIWMPAACPHLLLEPQSACREPLASSQLHKACRPAYLVYLFSFNVLFLCMRPCKQTMGLVGLWVGLGRDGALGPGPFTLCSLSCP